MNNYKYIDIDKLASDNNTLATVNKTLNTSLNLNKYNNLSLVKLDLTVDVPLMKVILDNNNPDVIIKDGYYKTIYNICLTYYNNESNAYEDKVYNVWFHRHWINNNKVEFKTDDNNNIVVNNFNDYFIIYNLEVLNHCVNESILNCFHKFINNTDTFNNCIPIFHCSNNILYYDVVKSFNSTSNNYRFYQSRDTLISSGDKYGFTIGYNYHLYNLYFKVYEVQNYKFNNELFYYMVDNYYGSTTKININNEDYYLCRYTNSSYYEYCSDIKGLLITTNIKTNSTFINIKTPDYEIKADDFIISDNGLNVFSRLNIDHDREHITRIIYTNSNIKNNTRTIYPDSNVQQISINLYFLDKYGYAYAVKMNKYDNYNIELCLF